MTQQVKCTCLERCESGVHHWLILSPVGEVTLPATCKHCPATRTFSASINQLTFNRATSRKRAKQLAAAAVEVTFSDATFDTEPSDAGGLDNLA